MGLDWVLSPLLSLSTAPGLGSREMRWGPLSHSVMAVARGGASVIRGRDSRCWEGKVGKRSLRRITGTCLWVQEYTVNRKYQSGPPLQNDLRTSCAYPLPWWTPYRFLVQSQRWELLAFTWISASLLWALPLIPLCILSPKASECSQIIF